MAVTVVPASPPISSKLMLRVIAPAESSAVITRSAVQLVPEPTTRSTATPPIFTDGARIASLADIVTVTLSPTVTVVSSPDDILTSTSEGVPLKAGPGLPLPPPPPQADKINENTSAEITPRCLLIPKMDNQLSLAVAYERITPPLKLHCLILNIFIDLLLRSKSLTGSEQKIFDHLVSPLYKSSSTVNR